MSVKYLLSQLKAKELRQRLLWKCPLKGHREHDGISHHTCYDRIKGVSLEEKIAFLDIEAEDIPADYGIMFCWNLLDSKTQKIDYDVLSLQDIKKYFFRDRDIQPKEDTRIIQSLIDKLQSYDRVITHYGSRYDLPFVRTRAIICGIPFPPYGALYQSDSWIILRNKFKLSRNTLQNAELKLTGKTLKDHLSLSIKHGAVRGEKWALDICVNHCKNDVLSLQNIWNLIFTSVRQTNTSI